MSAVEETLEEFQSRVRRWDIIIESAEEHADGDIGTSRQMEATGRKKLEERMRLFQSELAALPEGQRLAIGCLLTEKLAKDLEAFHVAALTLNLRQKGKAAETRKDRARAKAQFSLAAR